MPKRTARQLCIEIQWAKRWGLSNELLYRVVKQKFQVVKLVDCEHVNENMVQNSSPTCKHNLSTLIQSKRMFFECPGMWESLKRLRESKLLCTYLK